MTIYAQPGVEFEARLNGVPAGLLQDPTPLTFEIYDPSDGTSIIAPTSAAITEPRPGSYATRRTLAAGELGDGNLATRWVHPSFRPAEEDVVIGDGTHDPGVTGSPVLLATVEQLRSMLRTTGTVSAGAEINEVLLQDLLEAASSRIIEMASDRTLVADSPDADPVEVRLILAGPTTIVQVPDLRELVTLDVTRPALYPGAIDVPTSTLISTPTLIRRPRHACALWLRFPLPICGDELVITGRFGPAEQRVGSLDVLSAVREAALVWAARAYHNRTARYADSVQDPAGGVANYFRTLPADVASTINALAVPGI